MVTSPSKKFVKKSGRNDFTLQLRREKEKNDATVQFVKNGTRDTTHVDLKKQRFLHIWGKGKVTAKELLEFLLERLKLKKGSGCAVYIGSVAGLDLGVPDTELSNRPAPKFSELKEVCERYEMNDKIQLKSLNSSSIILIPHVVGNFVGEPRKKDKGKKVVREQPSSSSSGASGASGSTSSSASSQDPEALFASMQRDRHQKLVNAWKQACEDLGGSLGLRNIQDCGSSLNRTKEKHGLPKWSLGGLASPAKMRASVSKLGDSVVKIVGNDGLVASAFFIGEDLLCSCVHSVAQSVNGKVVQSEVVGNGERQTHRFFVTFDNQLWVEDPYLGEARFPISIDDIVYPDVDGDKVPLGLDILIFRTRAILGKERKSIPLVPPEDWGFFQDVDSVDHQNVSVFGYGEATTALQVFGDIIDFEGWEVRYTAPTAPRFSGGPVIDEYGHAVGVHRQAGPLNRGDRSTVFNSGVRIDLFLLFEVKKNIFKFDHIAGESLPKRLIHPKLGSIPLHQEQEEDTTTVN